MKGQEVYRFAVNALEDVIEKLLDDKKLSMDDMDLVICHQANERIINHVKKKYVGHENKFYINIADYGNTSAASIPIALSELNEGGKLKGKKCILAAFGAGLSYNGILLEL